LDGDGFGELPGPGRRNLEMENYASAGLVALIGGIISAKWAMELGFSQFQQLLWGIAGLIFAPVVLLILYVRMLYVRGRGGGPGGAWWTSGSTGEGT
jgi:hypothetical protein